MASMLKSHSTIDEKEVEKFSSLAQHWWDEEGSFKLLHTTNPIRIRYIKEQVCRFFNRQVNEMQPFKGLKLLDIGCGGGLTAIPMHKLGAEVLAVDASPENIGVASCYSQSLGLDIKFKCATAEDLVKSKIKFDIVLALEVIEHVADYKLFLQCIAQLLNKNGILILSTINRTLKSMLLAKLGAEYILRWVPVGTHDWNKFIKPEEIAGIFTELGITIVDIQGMNFDPLSTDKWCLSHDNYSTNYFLTAR